MRRSLLIGIELEKALKRAVKAWRDDEDLTLHGMQVRFRRIPRKLLKQRLQQEGLLPRPTAPVPLSRLRNKAVVPGQIMRFN